MRRLTSMFLVLAMLLSLAPMNIFAAETNNTVFSDMKETDYYAQAATALEHLGIISGYPDGTYGAEKSVTRAEMAVVVCKMIDKTAEAEEAKGKTDFDDVASDHWASGYINIAAKEGIISGDGNGKFRPEDEVKYEEALKMIVCALGYGDDVEFDETDWSKGYLKIAEEKGITADLKGKKGEAATRGDIAVMSYNGIATDAEDSKIPATPVASVKAGEYASAQKVALTTATKDAEIYYTTDGSTPTAKSTKYTKEITVSQTSTLKAVAVKNGVVSKNVLTVEYTIKKASSGGGGGGGGSSSGGSSTTAYTVSFNLNYDGATGAPASQSVISGNKATEPAAPEREGYIFIGWSTSANEEILFNFTSAITGSITLYALWANGSSDDTFSVTFILNDGSAGAYQMQRVPAYGRATRPEDPERELYEFTGWYTEADAINEYDFSARVTSDIILYAGWGAPDGEADLYAAGSGGGTKYSITGIEMINNQVNVTINTDEASVLIVKFLDENTNEIITTVSSETPSYCELVPVSVPVEYALPEHFIISADLYDGESNKRCESFRCIKYTTAYENFDKQTVSDFDENLVVNFDEDTTNNFGVLNQNVKKIICSETTNKLVTDPITSEMNSTRDEIEVVDQNDNEAELLSAEDPEYDVYVFENASEDILSLRAGDKVFIEGTSHLFKIASIENDGNGTVTIRKSNDVELKEFYDVLKVNMTVDPAEEDAALLWTPIDSEASFSINGDISFTPEDWLEVKGKVGGSGKIKLEVTYDWKFLQDDYFFISVISEMEINVNVEVKLKINNEDQVKKSIRKKEIKLPKFFVPTPVPGLTVSLRPSVPLEWELSGGVAFDLSSKMETGFTYSSYDGKQEIDKKERTVKINAEGSVTFKFGPKVGISVEFCDEVLKAELSAAAGIEAKAETSVGHTGTDADSKHGCTLCIEGTVKWYAVVNANLSYKLIEDLIEGNFVDWDIVKVEGNFPISPNFYFSLINSPDSAFNGTPKFGWGSCPNKTYRTRIFTKDSDGNDIATNVSITKSNGSIAASGTSPLTAYLFDGNYTAYATIDNESVSKSIVVSGGAQDIELTAESNDGSVYGKVLNSENNNPVPGATIIISQNGSIVTTAQSKNDGSYQVSLGDGVFYIETTKDGYIPFREYVTISNDATTYLQTTKLVPGDKNAKGGFSGRIVNNVNNEPIEGVTLKLRKGWNNKNQGEVIETLSTDANGNFVYEIKELFGVPVKLEVGNYTLVATKDGYATTTHNIIVRPNIVTSGQNFSMSPSLGDGKYRIRLSWGVAPRDLDSHLVGPTADGGTFHLYFPMADANGGHSNRDYYTLDLDDTTSYGPETTTIHKTVEGKYYFYIHNYSGEGSFGTSSAQVEVYKGDDVIAVYNAPLNQGYGIYWNVFVLDAAAGIITPVNTITDAPNTGSASLYSAEDGLNEDEILSMIDEDIKKAVK